jgi:glycosyltransferase involved in cell wall biosynthesis
MSLMEQEVDNQTRGGPVRLDDDLIAMLRGRPIVCCGTSQWNRAPNTPEHTMSVLAEATRVLYVEPFGSPLTYLRSSILERRVIPIRSGVRKLGDRLFVYTPPPLGIPFQHRYEFPRRANAALLSRKLHRITARLEMRDPILWIYTYHSSCLLGKLGEVAAVYDCLEQERAFAPKKLRQRVADLEDELSRRVDIVFAISPEVGNDRINWNEKTFVVRAGVNIRHFERSSTKAPKPAELEEVRGPILGYFGQLDPWKVDARLIREVARRRREWTVVLVGHVVHGFQLEVIADLPNVRLVGSRDYNEIPAFMQNFDVCLMPFLINEATFHGDHVKLYEYLASGKPVVSVDVPSARRFPDLVRVSRDVDEFIENVEAALDEKESRWQERVTVARAHSYHARVTEKIRALVTVLRTAR